MTTIEFGTYSDANCILCDEPIKISVRREEGVIKFFSKRLTCCNNKSICTNCLKQLRKDECPYCRAPSKRKNIGERGEFLWERMKEKEAIELDWMESGPELYRNFVGIEYDIEELLGELQDDYFLPQEDEFMDFYEISRKQLWEEYDIGFRDIMKIGCR